MAMRLGRKPQRRQPGKMRDTAARRRHCGLVPYTVSDGPGTLILIS